MHVVIVVLLLLLLLFYCCRWGISSLLYLKLADLSYNIHTINDARNDFFLDFVDAKAN